MSTTSQPYIQMLEQSLHVHNARLHIQFELYGDKSLARPYRPFVIAHVDQVTIKVTLWLAGKMSIAKADRECEYTLPACDFRPDDG